MDDSAFGSWGLIRSPLTNGCVHGKLTDFFQDPCLAARCRHGLTPDNCEALAKNVPGLYSITGLTGNLFEPKKGLGCSLSLLKNAVGYMVVIDVCISPCQQNLGKGPSNSTLIIPKSVPNRTRLCKVENVIAFTENTAG